MTDSPPIDDVQMDAPVDAPIDDTPSSSSTYIPPSVHTEAALAGASFTHVVVPPSLLPSSPEDPASAVPCCLGVDEAGRGPVLGPMVYGVFFLPLTISDSLLRDTHHFDDSKVLTPAVRSKLMRTICTPGSDLHTECGWAVKALSARDISAGMLHPTTPYNLNAQALDATVDLIKAAYAAGVNVQEIYVDTVGPPAAHQAKLQRFFPTAKITVTKKADSLFACVSAASVCAKVTRDATLEVLSEAKGELTEDGMGWGSGYSSDKRCTGWMKNSMHPLFGWGHECRFSWGTSKDMLEGKANGVKVEWPLEDDGETSRVTDFFTTADKDKESSELGNWFGTPAGLEAF
ncbi:hypothetical protein NW767_008096 [Fusarium falciforme]|nr:hypothetical protein NW767_008096 [Fusarium falciforme]KAJ4246744.1 hypothetical protein NW757_009331 [Fusarium falciforme]